MIEVRATITLPRLGAGSIAIVDESDAYIERLIKKGVLVPTSPLPEPLATEQPEPEPELADTREVLDEVEQPAASE